MGSREDAFKAYLKHKNGESSIIDIISDFIPSLKSYGDDLVKQCCDLVDKEIEHHGYELIDGLLYLEISKFDLKKICIFNSGILTDSNKKKLMEWVHLNHFRIDDYVKSFGYSDFYTVLESARTETIRELILRIIDLLPIVE
jgi:hypothetical protein